MDYVLSDLHLFHENLITKGLRPFASIKEMHRTIITNWNSVVKNKSDKVYVPGDVALGGSQEMVAKVIQQLRGYKILINGNHDRSKSNQWWLDVGFREVIKYPIILRNRYIISHEPERGIGGDYYNIHGHVHSPMRDKENSFCDHPSYFNVCCENTDYFPLDFGYIADTLHFRKYGYYE